MSALLDMAPSALEGGVCLVLLLGILAAGVAGIFWIVRRRRGGP